jgi:hypothetical protein
VDQATTFIQGTGHPMELAAIRSRTRDGLRSRARQGERKNFGSNVSSFSPSTDSSAEAWFGGIRTTLENDTDRAKPSSPCLRRVTSHSR